ncbi:MAG: isocitrate lyase/PEP mutase family protein [Burkholderiaceae bacterium]|jgi:2,3-dimethylmalate lyase|nr:isocitrate lyase/PEP mutase family protein [Burkholderiaceae bacterium]MDP4968659.1 isocitrate lyase/PEP mutase family protein [Burkholderiaceae bacterium]
MSMISATQKRRSLREQLKGTQAVRAPGIYDGYGARLVEQAGFTAAYMTGNGVSATLLGRPDVGLVDLTMMSDHARRVAASINIPLICDADTGYGNVVNVRRAITEFEAAGVAAIHMEDQVSPKRCAQMPGDRTVLDFDEAVAKVAAASAARTDPEFVLIARTDSAGSLGLAEAIRRGQAFARAGADAVFVELKSNPHILQNILEIKAGISVPIVVNVDSAKDLRQLQAAALKQAGVDLAIYPAMARGVFGYAMSAALAHLRSAGNMAGYEENMFTSAQYNEALGLSEVEAWEKRFD